MTQDLYAGLRLPKQRIHVRNASLFRRGMAFLADLLLLNMLVFSSYVPFLRTAAGEVAPPALASLVMIALLCLAYFSLFEYSLGQTPGMAFFGLIAENVTLWRAFVRNIYFLPIFPFPLLVLLEPIYLATKRTRFLEALSGTRTVERITY